MKKIYKDRAIVEITNDDNRKYFRKDHLTLQKCSDLYRTLEHFDEGVEVTRDHHVATTMRKKTGRKHKSDSITALLRAQQRPPAAHSSPGSHRAQNCHRTQI